MSRIKVFLLLLIFPFILLGSETKTIKDMKNRSVEVKKDVKRVIALGSSLSFISYLNSMHKIIAVEATEKNEVSKRTYTYVNKELIKKLPVIGMGDNTKQLNYESIIALKPDVIFTIRQDRNELKELFHKLKVPIVALSFGHESLDLKKVNQSLLLVGDILGKEKRAEELVLYINELKNSFKNIKDEKEAYISGLAFKGLQGLSSTKTNYTAFDLAKVHNCVSHFSTDGHVLVDEEFLLTYNPSIIFIDSSGLEKVKDEFNKNKEYFYKLKAFQNKQVYVTLASSYYFYINLDQMLSNSFFIAKFVYPDEYKNLNPVKKADEIFKKFVGRPMYRVLSNELNGFKSLELKDNNLIIKDI